MNEQVKSGAVATRPRQDLVSSTAPPVQGLITQAQELAAQIEAAREKFHIIAPVIATSQLGDGCAAAFSVVTIDPSPTSKEVYREGSELALTKLSLMRISAALGISWTGTERVDNGKRRNYWLVRVSGKYVAPDGSLQDIGDSKEVDYTDGSAQLAGMTDKQIARARMYGNEMAETKAKNRAIRNFGIKPGYTEGELKKPFLCVRFSYTHDMSNPEVARMVTAARLGVVNQLYPASPTPAPAQRPALNEATGEAPAQLGAGTAAETKPASPKPLRDAFEEDAPEKDTRPRLTVQAVKERNHAGLFSVILTTGEVLFTDDETAARVAHRAMKEKRAIVVDTTVVPTGDKHIDDLKVVDAAEKY